MAQAVTATLHPIDSENYIFQKAVEFVKNTDENLFLTGKAGTGKTTFLKYIRANTSKKCAVVAPTGVAAMNAGGETIHSFLQVPFGPFIPGNAGGFGMQGIAIDKHSLLAKLRLKDNKVKLIQKLELLIIDEISMVRCDLLDAIDLILRHICKKWAEPFGGKQVVFIGDMYQLPPVATQEDWEIISKYYPSPYFFDSKVLQQKPPLYIELKKIYRQKDPVFIDILNNIRNGDVPQHNIDTLNSQYNPEFKQEDGYILLTTHNRIADTINQEALNKLHKPIHVFDAVVKQEFNPKNYPTDLQLKLKEGAQVMFVKNDLQTPRRYYNGKIAKVLTINDAGIKVKFTDNEKEEPLLIDLEVWKNVRYTLNPKEEIQEEEIGSFTQYPIRLAWAITVHKSQGLTLDKAIVDLNQAFASGQVYVALSRCTTMSGLVLKSKITQNSVFVDERIIAFAENENDENELDEILVKSTRMANVRLLCTIFSFQELIYDLEQIIKKTNKLKTGPVENTLTLGEKLLFTLNNAQEHAFNFQKQLNYLSSIFDDEKLTERKKSAIIYFTDKVIQVCLDDVKAHVLLLATLSNKAKHEKYWKEVTSILQIKMNDLKSLK